MVGDVVMTVSKHLMRRAPGARGRGRRRGPRRARATAIVEFAVVLPLLLAIMLGIIEYGWVFLIRQTLQDASREGCRMMVMQTSVTPYTNVYGRVTAVMQPTGVSGYQTQLSHNGCEEVVTVSVPFADVSLVGGFFGVRTGDLVGTSSMRKEGCTGP